MDSNQEPIGFNPIGDKNIVHGSFGAPLRADVTPRPIVAIGGRR